MEIKIVPEMFTVFDGRSEDFHMLEPVRPFPQQFNRVKAQFITKFLPLYDDN